MQLQRYSTKELQDLCTEIFYEYMATTVEPNSKITHAHKLHAEHEDKLKQYTRRIEEYTMKLQQSHPTEVIKSSQECLAQLKEGASYYTNSNMENQKRVYALKKATDFCRSIVRIPLDKKINSYYDDFALDVAFYDDVTTLNGKFEEYKKLKTYEERYEFLKANTEITNIGLAYVRGTFLIAIISLMGNLNENDPRVTSRGTTLLSQKFSDFDSLTLKDTSEIGNNDLKQFIQSKIDLDKENMEELSSLIIRGDRYSIHKSPENDDLYIRYICRGTGRIYYNALNLNNLAISPLFKKGDCNTYAKAWWDLNTLGGNPDHEKPVIRC